MASVVRDLRRHGARAAVAFGALQLAGCGKSLSGAAAASDAAAGSSLSAPKCGSTPTQVVDLKALAADTGAALYGVELAVDAMNVYFGYDQALMAVPIRGGSVQTLARLPSDPDEIVVTSSYVVVPVRTGNEFNETLLSVPIAGGSAITLASSSTVFTGVAVDDRNVYFIDGEGTKSVPAAGGEVHLITGDVATSNRTGQGVVIGSNLIVPCCTQPGVVASTEGNILSVPLDGGMWEALAMGQPNASFPLACGAGICWWTGQTPFGVVGTSGPGFVARLAPDGGATTLPNAPYFPWSFTFDGTDFFETVGCDLCSGTLLRIPGSGAPVVTMGEGAFAAVDDECVYFSVLDGYFPSADGGTSGTGIFSVQKSYVPPPPQTEDAEPAGSILCSQTRGPVDAGATDVGATRWCTPPSGCEPFNGEWACCFYDSIGNTSCDLIGDASALTDDRPGDSE